MRYSTTDVYRAVQPFYLWPTPHCDVAKSLLDIVQGEDVKGGQLLFLMYTTIHSTYDVYVYHENGLVCIFNGNIIMLNVFLFVCLYW